MQRGRMYFVYILKSKTNQRKTYVGYTSDLKRRLRDHNSGQSEYSKPFSPWELEMYLAFASLSKAKAFERYLKEGGGWRFAKRRLM